MEIAKFVLVQGQTDRIHLSKHKVTCPEKGKVIKSDKDDFSYVERTSSLNVIINRRTDII